MGDSKVNILFIEPPKEFWFVMGEYMPPPLGILQLAAFLESKNDEWEIDVLDCQIESIGWHNLKKRIESSEPSIVVCSGLATCNTYTVLRTLDIVKKVNPQIKTVVGGQHFTALAHESLESYPIIDFIIRGEGELTLYELISNLENRKTLHTVMGLSFQNGNEIVHNPPRPLINNLDDLPLPGYHFIADGINKYHFKLMAGSDAGYAMVEASRGCQFKCKFCSQWVHWSGRWRTKSPKRVAMEMEHLYNEYDIRFLWLTDDNLGLGKRTSDLCDKLINKDINEDLMWFVQARSDDIIKNSHILPKMRKAGNYWIMTGLERHDEEALKKFNKQIKASDSKLAIDILKDNGIFAQATLIIGERKDSHQSLEEFREFVNHVDPDIAITMILTPFPGTEIYQNAERNGWIEDHNWSNYDMVHAIMPTEYLTRLEVQEELYKCYRDFYGSMRRRITGIFSQNKFKRKTYRYMAGQGLLQSMKELF